MKKTFIIALLAASAALAGSAKKNLSDEVILTVDKNPTTLAEFEYLYNKNNSQQAQKQTPEEYMELFSVYKLKVADAVAAGIDRSDSFRDEFNSYKNSLAAPYFYDRDKFNRMVRDAYHQMNREREVSHIMFSDVQDRSELPALMARIDSIRNVIRSGQATFDEMAVKYSIDGMARRSGRGYMGFISNNNIYPYPFVGMAFNTPVGEISEPVNSGFGWHIILVHSERPVSKQVLVEHILKLTQGKSPEEAGKQKAAIDSIYTLLTTTGADFNAVAIKESEDPGSARQGGKLDWFGTGRMVPEFEKASMELGIGETSEPVKTTYGYHIIHKINERDSVPFEEVREMLEQQVNGDERMATLQEENTKMLRERFRETLHPELLAVIAAEIDAAGGADSAYVEKLKTDKRPYATYEGGEVTVGEIVRNMPALAKLDGKAYTYQMDGTFKALCSTLKLRELEADRLSREDADFRNLVNEYHDGILLYEISNRNVWEKSSSDKEGLENFFNRNRAKYAVWERPRFKGYIVFATSDSIAQGAEKLLMENNVPAEESVTFLRKTYGKDIRVERVIAEQGKNDIIDHIAFGAPKPAPKGKWIAYFPYQYKTISQPEEASDVRGEVTADWQNELNDQWVARLKKQHKVKINKGLLKKISQPE